MRPDDGTKTSATGSPCCADNYHDLQWLNAAALATARDLRNLVLFIPARATYARRRSGCPQASPYAPKTTSRHISGNRRKHLVF